MFTRVKMLVSNRWKDHGWVSHNIIKRFRECGEMGGNQIQNERTLF